MVRLSQLQLLNGLARADRLGYAWASWLLVFSSWLWALSCLHDARAATNFPAAADSNFTSTQHDLRLRRSELLRTMPLHAEPELRAHDAEHAQTKSHGATRRDFAH